MAPIVVAAVAFTRAGTLLTVRKRGTGMFMLPGGKLEPGESPMDAARREVAEEVGLEVAELELRGTRFGDWVGGPFVGMHYCNYAPSAAVVAVLEEAGVVVGATAPDAGAEVLELPDHPFYVVSMFQPHIGASEGKPIHALIRAFASAVRTAARGSGAASR